MFIHLLSTHSIHLLLAVTSSLALAAAGTTEPESAEHVPSHQTSINHSGSFHLLEKDPDENHVAFD